MYIVVNNIYIYTDLVIIQNKLSFLVFKLFCTHAYMYTL